MGVTPYDRKTKECVFDVNFWNWRPIVEAIRGLGVLPMERIDNLHLQFCGMGLSESEARTVAVAIRAKLLPTLKDKERLLLDGSRTTVPDDYKFHTEPAGTHLNYGTDRQVLETFVICCETCNGFDVN
ncbi:MAG: hypothetical protein WCI73_15165 [Phycisphaerae bacterium]